MGSIQAGGVQVGLPLRRSPDLRPRSGQRSLPQAVHALTPRPRFRVSVHPPRPRPGPTRGPNPSSRPSSDHRKAARSCPHRAIKRASVSPRPWSTQGLLPVVPNRQPVVPLATSGSRRSNDPGVTQGEVQARSAGLLGTHPRGRDGAAGAGASEPHLEIPVSSVRPSGLLLSREPPTSSRASVTAPVTRASASSTRRRSPALGSAPAPGCLRDPLPSLSPPRLAFPPMRRWTSSGSVPKLTPIRVRTHRPEPFRLDPLLHDNRAAVLVLVQRLIRTA